MTYVVGSACVDVMDKSCVAECPVDCIYEGARSLYINPDECVDCGACKLICRVDAIEYETDLSADELVHLADNAYDALETIGAAGGMEVLVEAGPTLTAHMLSASLWDEHVLIEQAANPDGTDRLTLRGNPAPHLHTHGKENDVFGHH